jgi:uncharacterized protein (DUF1330 family)
MLRTSAIVAASFIAGVSAVQVLHAQSKAPVYSVSVIDIKDNDGYKNAVRDVRKRIGDMGGKYLVAAGVAGSGEMMADGDKVPSRLVITEWANLDAYKKWWTEVGEKDIKMLHQYTNSFKLYAAEGIAK